MWVGGSSDTFSERRFRGRVRGLSLAFAFGCAVIVIRLFDLQVLRGADMALLSESNRTQVIFLRAPRGDFFDRHGRAIVRNRPTWSLMYSVGEKHRKEGSAVRSALMPFLSPFPVTWERRLARAHQTGQMVRLVENVPDDLAFIMREMEHLFPGLRVVMEFRRGYPMGAYAAHLIGYLGEVSERELKVEDNSHLKLGDLIGKMGLERAEDEFLRGEDGGMLIEVDSVGRLKRVIKELPFQKGGSVHLTVDLDLQKIAEDSLAETPNKRGAVVFMDVNTGAILVWASAPSFDPLGSLADELKDPRFPFLDRVYRGAYPPASVFKPITAMAAFEKDMINTSRAVHCVGYVMLKDRTGGERKYRCWKTHGWVDYWRAMAESCDTYFYLLGQQIGSQSISEISSQFGLGQTTQDTLPGEVKGVVPNPNWKRRAGLGGWSTGDTFNMSIGQGYLTSTPLQVASFYQALATRGRTYMPYLVDTLNDGSGRIVEKSQPRLLREVKLKDVTWDRVHRSLEGVVQSGTAGGTRIDFLDVRGKTGTAQNPHGDDHAWFAGYAGYNGEPPRYAVAVFVENGGHGGVAAVPIARKIIEAALPMSAAPKGTLR